MISKLNRLAPLGIICFWALLTLGAYFAFNEFFKPVPQVITSSGDLLLTRARDGHFYAEGAVNGTPVRFLVDTGATLVVVNEKLARSVGLTAGEPTVFRTANGALQGYIASNATVAVGTLSISNMRVGVGLALGSSHGSEREALLGQNFLSKFDVVIRQDQMTLRMRGAVSGSAVADATSSHVGG
jgi:aspartyl protease family protein